MKWKSFKDEQPLEDQRVLIYVPEYLDWHVHYYAGERELNKLLYNIKDVNLCYWISIPLLPE